MEALQIILTAIGGIITYIISKEYIAGYVIQFFKWLFNRKKEKDNNNIDATKELIDIRNDNNEVYENQIEFLTQQVKNFEERITFKQNELNKYLDELQELRQKIVKMQELIFDNQMKIAKLQAMCCAKLECPDRIQCANKC